MVCKLTLSVARGQYEPVAALPSAVAAGKTTAAKVATAFTRLMRARIRLGMLGTSIALAPRAFAKRLNDTVGCRPPDARDLQQPVILGAAAE